MHHVYVFRNDTCVYWCMYKVLENKRNLYLVCRRFKTTTSRSFQMLSIARKKKNVYIMFAYYLFIPVVFLMKLLFVYSKVYLLTSSQACEWSVFWTSTDSLPSPLQCLACEYNRLSSLLAARNVSLEKSPIARRGERRLYSQAICTAFNVLVRFSDATKTHYSRRSRYLKKWTHGFNHLHVTKTYMPARIARKRNKLFKS